MSSLKQSMQTHTGSAAMRYRFLLDAAKQRHVKAESLYKYQIEGNALLVEPVNGNPYVLIDHTPAKVASDVAKWIISVHVFESDPRSGTDHLRARIAAQMFFDTYCEGLKRLARVQS